MIYSDFSKKPQKFYILTLTFSTKLLTLLIAISPVFDLQIFVQTYISIYFMQLLDIGPMPKIYNTLIVFGIFTLYKSGIKPIFIPYMQLFGIILIVIYI